MGPIMEPVSLEDYHRHVRHNRKNYTVRWRGIPVMKYAPDLVTYSQVIFRTKPDWIIEAGTAYGGSSLFFGDMLELSGGSGKVISIDINAVGNPPHPKVEYIKASSTDRSTVALVKQRIFEGTGNVMLVLDSAHHRVQVSRELRLWSPLVTVGQYIAVEDCCYPKGMELVNRGAGVAVNNFLEKMLNFKREPLEEQFIFSVIARGWIKRIA